MTNLFEPHMEFMLCDGVGLILTRSLHKLSPQRLLGIEALDFQIHAVQELEPFVCWDHLESWA